MQYVNFTYDKCAKFLVDAYFDAKYSEHMVNNQVYTRHDWILYKIIYYRAKNFEKGGEYDKTWKASEDGKVNTNGPRMVVDQGGAGPQSNIVTRYITRHLCL